MSMKLVLVSPYPEVEGTITGGVEGACDVLIQGLLKSGEFKIHILAPCSNRNPGIEKRGVLTIYWIKGSLLPGFLDYWTIYRYRVNKCLKKIEPDIVHYQGVLGWMFGNKYPAIATLHGISEKDVLYSTGRFMRVRYYIVRTIENIARRRAKNIILISKYITDEIGKYLTGRQWPIENPVTDDFFKVVRNNNKNEILYIGRINKRKNILGMLSIFSKVSSEGPDANLTIAGDYDSKQYYDECIGYVNDNKLNDAVTFTGSVNRKQVLELLSNASCLILISHQETAPIIVEEAMSAGVPVIASKICGLPYMIDEGNSGYLVDVSNEDDIKEKLISLLLNDELNIKMGKAGREIAKKRFQYEIVANKTYAAYSEAMAEK